MLTAKRLQEKRERKALKRKKLRALKRRVGMIAYDEIRMRVRAREFVKRERMKLAKLKKARGW